MIEWANQHSAMRTELLTPSNDPFSIADSLIDELLGREIDSRGQPTEHAVCSMRETINRKIHNQVYELLDHLIANEGQFRWNEFDEERKIWNRIRTQCASRGMYWNAKSMQYEFSR